MWRLLLLLVLMAAEAKAAEYSSVDEAVHHAAQAARAIYANNSEAISIVYEVDGKFYFTPPASRGRSNKQASNTVKIPPGSARFIVHNHPSGEAAAEFNEDDISIADKLGVPSAIIFGDADPSIRVYRPGQSRVKQSLVQGQRIRTSLGDPFVWPPTDLTPQAVVPNRALLAQ